MDNTAACSCSVERSKQTTTTTKKNQGKEEEPKAEGERGAGEEGKSLVFTNLPISRTLFPLHSLPWWKKSWRVFLAFSSPAARWKG